MVKESRYSKNIEFSKPVLVDSEMIKELCGEVNKVGEKLNISIRFNNNLELDNISIDDLISYKNYEDEKIEQIRIDGGIGYFKEWIDITIGKDYSCNIRVVVRSENKDVIELVEKNIERIIERHNHDKEYQYVIANTFIEKIFKTMWIIVLINALIGYVTKGEYDIIQHLLNEKQIIILYTMLIIVSLFYGIFSCIKRKYYVPFVIAIGKEREKYEDLSMARKAIYYSLIAGAIIEILSLIIGIVVAR